MTLTHRGTPVARIEPIGQAKRRSATEHPAFGMWKDREELADPSAYVRESRNCR